MSQLLHYTLLSLISSFIGTHTFTELDLSLDIVFHNRSVLTLCGYTLKTGSMIKKMV